MERMPTLSKDNRAFIARKFYPWSHAFKSGLTNTTDFIIATSIPSPPCHAVKALDSNPESRLGAGSVIVVEVSLQTGHNGCVTLPFS